MGLEKEAARTGLDARSFAEAVISRQASFFSETRQFITV